MNADLLKLLESQAAWQRARARLTWPEKIRMAETMRDAALKLRARPVLKDQTSHAPRERGAPASAGLGTKPAPEH